MMCQNQMEFHIEKDDSSIGTRIDRVCSEHLPDFSRSRIQKLIDEGAILVNDGAVRSNYKLRANDHIMIQVPEPVDYEVQPENISLNIVYEDEDLLVVDKPRGMVVHPAHGHESGTLVNALMYHCKDRLSGINGVMRPGIVHRIDKDTSGLLVVCKSDRAHIAIADRLKTHDITRVYTALAKGNISADGTINAPIGRHKRDRKKMAVCPIGEGKHAVTHYHVIEEFHDYTLLSCQLETGRTHQIRVHLNYINHPILGDLVYGKKDSLFPHLNGQLLHASVLGFIHPITGEYMEFSSPLPDYFNDVLKKLRHLSGR